MPHLRQLDFLLRRINLRRAARTLIPLSLVSLFIALQQRWLPAWGTHLWWWLIATAWLVVPALLLWSSRLDRSTKYQRPRMITHPWHWLLYPNTFAADIWLRRHGFIPYDTQGTQPERGTLWRHKQSPETVVIASQAEALPAPPTPNAWHRFGAHPANLVTLLLITDLQPTESDGAISSPVIAPLLQQLATIVAKPVPIYLFCDALDQWPEMEAWWHRLEAEQQRLPLGIHFSQQQRAPEELKGFWQEWRAAEHESLISQLHQHQNSESRHYFGWQLSIDRLAQHTGDLLLQLTNLSLPGWFAGCYFLPINGATRQEKHATADSEPYPWLIPLLNQARQLHQHSPAVLARQRHKTIATGIIASLLIMLLWYHWHQIWLNQHASLQQWLTQHRAFTSASLSAWMMPSTFAEMLNPHAGNWSWGLYLSPHKQQQALYQRYLQQELQPRLMARLVGLLQQAPRGSAGQHDVLRAIRALDSPRADQNHYLQQFLLRLDSQEFQPILPHLDKLLTTYNWQQAREQHDAEATARFAPFASIILDAQQYWRDCDVSTCFYALLRQHLLWQLQDQPLQLGPHARTLFAVTHHVPPRISGLFTPQGYAEFQTSLAQSEQWQQRLTWLVSPLAPHDKNATDTTAELIARYRHEYQAAWRDAMQQLVIDANDRQQLEGIFHNAVAGMREVEALWVSNMLPVLPAQRGVNKQEESMLTNLSAYQPVTTEEWQALEQLFVRIEKNLHVLWQHKDLPTSLNEIASDLHAFSESQLPVESWTQQLTASAHRVIAADVRQQIEYRWRQEIIEPFERKLAPNFPFAPTANSDAAPEHIEQLLAPNGKIAQFFATNLDSFGALDADIGGSLQPNNDILAFRERLSQIQRWMFDSEGHLDIKLRIKPLSLSPNSRRVVLNLAGQLIDYRHGAAQESEVHWPNDKNPQSTNTINWVGVDGNEAQIDAAGVWGFWHLLFKSQKDAPLGQHVQKFNQAGFAASYRIVEASGQGDLAFIRSEMASLILPKQLFPSEDDAF